MSSRSDRLAVEALPLPKSPVDQGDLLRRLVQEDTTLRLVYDRSKPFILLHRSATTEEEALTVEQTLHDTVRVQPMEEYTVEGEPKPPHQQLFEMFDLIASESLEVSHLLVGNRPRFEKWLGTKFPRTKPASVLGVPIVFSSKLEQDTFMLCGAPTREALPREVRFSVKGVID